LGPRICDDRAMTGSPLDTEVVGPNAADDAPTPIGIAPRRSCARCLALLLLGAALADIGLAFLGLDPQAQIGFEQLVLFAVLGLYALGFAAAFNAVAAEGVAASAAAVAALVERRQRLLAALLIGLGIAGALLAVWTLRAFPNSGDEYDYLFEAKTFLAGRLWNPLPPLPALFAHSWIVFLNGKWVASYPPGWPLLLAAVMSLGLPSWLASPLCGGVLLFAVLKLGQKRDGALGGVLAATLVAISPFFLFNAGSYFDHVPVAAAGLLFCWAALAFLAHPRWPNAIAAGLALGMIGLIRSQDAVLFGLPFAVEFLLRARRRHYRLAPAIALAGLPFLAALLLYNHAVYGSLIPNLNLESPDIRFGLFPVDDQGHRLTPWHELRFVVERVILLSSWSSLLLVLGYIAAFGFVAYRRRLDFLDFIFPVCVLGFMLVPFLGGNQYGPRYYFEGFPFLVLTVVSALVPLLQESRFLRWRPLAVALLVAHGAACLAAMAVIVPFLRTVIDQRMDIYDQVQTRNLRNAVVVIHSSTGAISPMGTFDLTRDGIAVDGRVLYVRDIPDQIEKLHRLLPDRQFYIYTRNPGDPKGSLRPLW
ncbi:MAG TPA: glycosyltransferase family 39 protein, partial [Xanthobacteraceae bacterium]